MEPYVSPAGRSAFSSREELLLLLSPDLRTKLDALTGTSRNSFMTKFMRINTKELRLTGSGLYSFFTGLASDRDTVAVVSISIATGLCTLHTSVSSATAARKLKSVSTVSVLLTGGTYDRVNLPTLYGYVHSSRFLKEYPDCGLKKEGDTFQLTPEAAKEFALICHAEQRAIKLANPKRQTHKRAQSKKS